MWICVVPSLNRLLLSFVCLGCFFVLLTENSRELFPDFPKMISRNGNPHPHFVGWAILRGKFTDLHDWEYLTPTEKWLDNSVFFLGSGFLIRCPFRQALWVVASTCLGFYNFFFFFLFSLPSSNTFQPAFPIPIPGTHRDLRVNGEKGMARVEACTCKTF